MSRSAILLLEPDPTFADIIRATLEGAGHPVTVIDDPEQAIKLAGDHALVMVDVADAGAPDGIVAQLRQPSEQGQRLSLGVAQGDDIEERIRLIEAGADDVIVKPFDGTELEAKVEALLVRLRRRGDTAAVGAGMGPAVVASSSSSAPRAASGPRRWRSTPPSPWPRADLAAWRSSISTSNGVRCRRTSTCVRRRPSRS